MAFWSAKDYTPFFLWEEPVHTNKEIRAEYSRIRSILRKRANRLREAGFSSRADYIDANIPAMKDLKTNQAVAEQLAQAHTILESNAFSLAGLKRIQDEIFNETGFKIPLSDIWDFNDYMESWRTSKYRYLVDTNTALRLYYSEYQEIGGSFVNFYEIYIMRKAAEMA